MNSPVSSSHYLIRNRAMLKKVVEQLSETQYEELHGELVAGRGEKFVRLLELFRKPGYEEEKIRSESGASGAAYYTLKSRLQDKVQEYLFRCAADNRGELLKNISAVSQLVYHAPRETAISMLEFLENELKELDMPAELANVYNGMKKLHLNSPSFFHYQQLYNKNIAYSLAIDKSEELISLFTRELGNYLLSPGKENLPVLALYLKEMQNLSRLYDSHRLRSARLIVHISFLLFTGEEDTSEETAEDLIRQFREILDQHPDGRPYRFLHPVWHFFNFMYYHQLGLHRNGKASFEQVEKSAIELLRMNHTAVVALFLTARCERDHTLPELNIAHETDPEDIFSSVQYGLYRAAVCFNSEQFAEASGILNKMINDFSLRNFPFAESQIKLFLTLSLIMAGKTDQAEVILRSIARKLASPEMSGMFPAAQEFCRMLKASLNDNSAQKAKKISQSFALFNQLNNGRDAILKFIRLNDEHLKTLSR